MEFIDVCFKNLHRRDQEPSERPLSQILVFAPAILIISYFWWHRVTKLFMRAHTWVIRYKSAGEPYVNHMWFKRSRCSLFVFISRLTCSWVSAADAWSFERPAFRTTLLLRLRSKPTAETSPGKAHPAIEVVDVVTKLPSFGTLPLFSSQIRIWQVSYQATSLSSAGNGFQLWPK